MSANALAPVNMFSVKCTFGFEDLNMLVHEAYRRHPRAEELFSQLYQPVVFVARVERKRDVASTDSLKIKALAMKSRPIC